MYFLLFLLSLFAFSQDWDVKFNEVCSRDKFCSRLKATDGTWLRPKSEIIALLKDNDVQNEIKTAAAKYGVDPTAIAGAIMAENSLNVGVKDSVQTFLASKMGITSIAGKNFSFGLGQIQLPATREAEEHIAKIEKRKPRGDDELRKEIADPMGSIRMAALIVRKVQDDYKAQGFDISKDPGVLTTLYNLGQSERRAAEAKANNKLPQVNYFGLFVDKYTADIKATVKLTPAAQVASSALQPAVLPSAKPTAKADSELARGISAKPEVVTKPNRNLAKVDYVTRSVPLTSAPLLCETSTYGQDVARETRSASFGSPIGALEKDETFRELSRTLDCRSNPWKLVKGSDSKIGWVQEEQLEKVRSSRLSADPKCESAKKDTVCNLKVEKAIAKMNPRRSNDGLIQLNPIAKSGAKKISFTVEDFQCGNKIPIVKDDCQNCVMQSSGARELSREEVKKKYEELNRFVDNQLKRMSAEINIPLAQLEEPENAYSATVNYLQGMQKSAQMCLRALNSENAFCGNPDGFSDTARDQFSNFKYKKNPSLDEVNTHNQTLTNTLTQQMNDGMIFNLNYYTPNSQEVNSTSIDEIKESLADCETRTEALYKMASQIPLVPPSNQVYGGGGFGGFMGGININSNLKYGMMGIPSVTADKIFEAAKKATDQQIKAHAKEFISYAKFCHARHNLLDNNKKPNPLNCAQAPKYLPSGFQLYAKDLVAKTYQQYPSTLVSEIKSVASEYVKQATIDEILGPQQAQQPHLQNAEDFDASYCPNKTAEFIEDLVKSNSCIKRVFVPTRYLSNKLSGLNAKVIYRQFEGDDKYAIDLGADPLCK